MQNNRGVRAGVTIARALLVVVAMLAGIGCFDSGAQPVGAQDMSAQVADAREMDIPARAGVVDAVTISAPEAIVINEILAHTDPPLQDTIEFHNLSAEAVDISQWCISDKNDEPCRDKLPEGSVIAPSGFITMSFQGSTFGLLELGETVTLSQANSNQELLGYAQRVTFGATPNGISLGRVVTSDGVAHYPMLTELSLGEANGAARSTPVAIDQIMYHPTTGKPQYIRITNHANVTQLLHHAELAGHPWQIEGIGTTPLPDGLSLQPGESLYFSSGTVQEMRSAYGLGPLTKVIGPWEGLLKDEGNDRLALLRPDVQEKDLSVPMVEVDAVQFGIGAPWPVIGSNAGVALQRLSPWAFGQEPGNWTDQAVQSLWLPSVAAR